MSLDRWTDAELMSIMDAFATEESLSIVRMTILPDGYRVAVTNTDMQQIITELLTLRGYIRRPFKHQHPSNVNALIAWICGDE